LYIHLPSKEKIFYHSLDAGSEKTLIAILRMRYGAGRGSQKVSWFSAHSVALCEQQHGVIKDNMHVPIGLIHHGGVWTKVVSYY
jgi:hypothetical protein